MVTSIATRPSARVTPYTESVAAQVRAEVARAGIRQRQLAERFGLTPSAISARWRGDTPWTVNELAEIAALLGVEVGDLLPRLDSNQQPAEYPYLLVSALLCDVLARSAVLR